MSQENVEIMRRVNALFNDGAQYHAMIDAFHPDCEWRDLAHGPDAAEIVRGRDAIWLVWQQWDVFDEFGAEVFEYLDADPWVICDTRWHGTGKASGVAIDLRQADAFEFRNGLIVRAIIAYPNVGAALKAVGLEE
jgi:ketosteroid isomerase-like protein